MNILQEMCRIIQQRSKHIRENTCILIRPDQVYVYNVMGRIQVSEIACYI